MTSGKTLYVIVAYDTPSDRRRARIAKTLRGFAERKQYSVWEARLTREHWSLLKGRLAMLVDRSEDNIAVYFLAPEAIARTWRIGNAQVKELTEPEIV